MTEGKNVSDNAELCRITNNYFSEIISSLKIPNLINNSAVDSNAITNPLSIATKLFDQHSTIIKIKKKNFDSVCPKDDIPTKVIKMYKYIFAGFIAKDFNNCVDKCVFPNDVKHADVTPIHKKKDKSDKTNYRPVSILPNISKIYEKLIYNQLYDCLMTDYLLVNVVSARGTVRTIAYLSC